MLELIAPPDSKLKDHPLSAVCACLFNILALLYPQPEDAPRHSDKGRTYVITLLIATEEGSSVQKRKYHFGFM
jgi:hypothetical protein